MSTTIGPMSVRYLLFGSQDAGDALTASLEDRGLGGTVADAVGGLTSQGRHAVCGEIGHVADSLLNLDVTDVLFAAWRKQQNLMAAAFRTTAHPGSEEMVELATHRITSTHRPHVDVYVDGMEITRIDMELTLSLLVRGLLGTVSHGRLVAISAGTCEATAALACERQPIAKRTVVYDLPGDVRLGDGIDLLAPLGTTARR